MATSDLFQTPTEGHFPWWSTLLARKSTRSVFGFLSVSVLVVSLGYGIVRIDRPNFDSSAATVKLQVTVADGKNAQERVMTLPSQQESRTLSGYGKWKLGFLLLWIVGPPAYFWFEYVGLYRYATVSSREEFPNFQYMQDISSKVWLALVTALTILYFGKDLRV